MHICQLNILLFYISDYAPKSKIIYYKYLVIEYRYLKI